MLRTKSPVGATGVRAAAGKLVQMIEVRQVRTPAAIGIGDPVGESRTVGGDLKIPGAALEFEALADEAHRTGISLEETEIGVTGDGEFGLGVVGGELFDVGCG